jgi:hypothetical protein
MRRNRWIIYQVEFGLMCVTPNRLQVNYRFPTHKAALPVFKAMLDDGECVHLTSIQRSTAKASSAPSERWIDRAFRHKYGLRRPACVQAGT